MTTHDPYTEQITDRSCLRMREMSGRVDDRRPLVTFLYQLARDHLAIGIVEEIMKSVERASVPNEDSESGPTMFTNGWLARWAQDVADRFEEAGR